MADLKIEVFTNPRCPNCPGAVKATKNLLKTCKGLAGRVKWTELSTATSKGSKKARRYGIRSVPTIIITDRRGNMGGFTGTPTERKYVEAVYELLGEDPPKQEPEVEQSKSFLSNLFGGGG